MGVGRSAKYSAKHRTTSRTHSARLLSKRGDNIPLTFSRGKESAFSQSRARQNDVESAACTPRRLHWYYVHIISGTFSFSLGFVFSGNVPRGNRLTSVKKIGVSFFPNRKRVVGGRVQRQGRRFRPKCFNLTGLLNRGNIQSCWKSGYVFTIFFFCALRSGYALRQNTRN